MLLLLLLIIVLVDGNGAGRIVADNVAGHVIAGRIVAVHVVLFSIVDDDVAGCIIDGDGCAKANVGAGHVVDGDDYHEKAFVGAGWW